MNKYLKENDRLWCEEVADDYNKTSSKEVFCKCLVMFGVFIFGMAVGAIIF